MIKSVHNINGASAAANSTGAAVPSETTQNASVIATIASATSPSGTLYLEASNQPAAAGTNEPPSGSWATVDSVAMTANGTDGVVATECAYRWLRARWAYTSGTGGTIDVYLQANGS